MSLLNEYLVKLPEENANRMGKIFRWIVDQYPNLEPRIAWNQPMFTDHGTFIIGFSSAKKHMSVTPEAQAMPIFTEKIKSAGYDQTKMLFRIKWEEPVDYNLLSEIMEYNMKDKADCTTFWRK